MNDVNNDEGLKDLLVAERSRPVPLPPSFSSLVKEARYRRRRRGAGFTVLGIVATVVVSGAAFATWDHGSGTSNRQVAGPRPVLEIPTWQARDVAGATAIAPEAGLVGQLKLSRDGCPLLITARKTVDGSVVEPKVWLIISPSGSVGITESDGTRGIDFKPPGDAVRRLLDGQDVAFGGGVSFDADPRVAESCSSVDYDGEFIAHTVG